MTTRFVLVLHCLQAPIDDYCRIDISPASLTTLSMDGSGLRVEGVNERVHA